MGRHYPAKERLRLVKLICDTYAKERVTIASTCKSNGISVRTLTEWCTKSSELSELYKSAQQEHDGQYMAELKEKAKTALEKLVEGVDMIETIQEGTVGADGTFKKEGKARVVKKKTPPNAVATIFALTNTDSRNFKNRHYQELTGKNGGAIAVVDQTLKDCTIEQLFFLKHGRKPEKGELSV